MNVTTAPREERRMFGIGIILASQVVFVMIDPSAKWLAANGLPTTEIIFVRYAVHLALVVGYFLPRQRLALVRTRNLWLELARGAALFTSTVVNFLAVQFLPVTMTGSIQFTQPLIICILSIPLLGELVGWRRWSAIGVGFIGVLIIIRPGTGDFNPAVFLSLTGATAGAFYSILMRRLAGVDSAATQQFYAALLAVCCVTPFAFGHWVWPQNPATWFAFAAIGIAGMLGHQLATVAARFAPASVLAPFSYLQIVYLTAISWLIFNQPPTVWIFAGAAIVIGSGLYMGLRERKLSRPTTPVAVED
jgi:drug/metabolite transporter (DMT)-like permease